MDNETYDDLEIFEVQDLLNKYYLKIREDSAIIDAFSDGPHYDKSTDGYILFGEGGYQLRLIINGKQTEENPPIFDMDGVSIYKYVDGEVIERTEDEIEDERLAIPPAPPSPMEQLRADVDFIALINDISL